MVERIKDWFRDLSKGGKIFVAAAVIIIVVSIVQEVLGG
jgi:FtsH-binding integral membrane protein